MEVKIIPEGVGSVEAKKTSDGNRDYGATKYVWQNYEITAYSYNARWYLENYTKKETELNWDKDEGEHPPIENIETDTPGRVVHLEDNPIKVSCQESQTYGHEYSEDAPDGVGDVSSWTKYFYEYSFLFEPRTLIFEAYVLSADSKKKLEEGTVDSSIIMASSVPAYVDITKLVAVQDTNKYEGLSFSCDKLSALFRFLTTAKTVKGNDDAEYRLAKIELIPINVTTTPFKTEEFKTEDENLEISFDVDEILRTYREAGTSVSIQCKMYYVREPTNLIMRLKGKWWTSGYPIRSKASGLIIRDA